MADVRFTISPQSNAASGYLAQTGLVATVFPADRGTEANWKESRRTFTIPFGRSAPLQSLPDGRYVIECLVPGGDVWQREFTLDGEALEIRLSGDRPNGSREPNEPRPLWRIEDSLESVIGLTSFESDGSFTRRSHPRPRVEVRLLDQRSAEVGNSRRPKFVPLSASDLNFWIDPDKLGGSSRLRARATDDGWLIRVPLPSEEGIRGIVTIRTATNTWFASVAAVADAPVMQAILVDLDRRRPTSSSHAPIVQLGSPDLDPLLAYLGDASFTLARSALSRAEDLLYGKRRDPLSAAAGAYALIGSLDPQQPEGQPWHQWVNNLAEWFPWMSDGPILQAQLLLRRGPDYRNLDRAAASVVEAIDRGLPYFSLGVRWLYECALQLEAFRPRIREAIPAIASLARRVDPSQPFTVLDADRG